MAVAVRSASSNSGSSSSTLALTKPAGTVSGDVLVCIIWQDSDGTPANLLTLSGWTQAGADIAKSGTSPYGKAWYKVAGGSEPASYTWTTSTNASTVGIMLALTGADTTTPIRINPSAGVGTGTSLVAPTVGSGTVPPVGDLLLSSFSGQNGAAITLSTPAGMTSQANVDTTWVFGGAFTQVVGVAGATGTRTSTIGTAVSGNWRAFSMVVSQPAAKSGSATANVRLAASATNTAISRGGSPTAALLLTSSTTGFQTRSGSAAATTSLTTAVTGGKGAAGSAAAAGLLLTATGTGNKVNVGLAVVRLVADVSDVLHAGTGAGGTRPAGLGQYPSATLYPGPDVYPAGPGTGMVVDSLLLTAGTSLNSRATAVPIAALLRLLISPTATSTRTNSATATSLYLSAEISPAGRIITAIATQILIRPAPTTTYELVCVARVMQPSGPPVFLEVDPIDWTGLSYTEELSKAPQLNAGCQISGLTEPVLQRLRKPAELPTELWLRRNGRLVFAGPLFTAQVQGESLTFNAQGALGYLRLMDVVADLVFANVDQFKVATGLIDQWQSLPYGNFGIDTSNLAPSGVLRDATYLAKELHNVGQRVEELGLRQNGFDIWVDPSSRRLQLAYPQRGVDRSSGEDAIVFDERNITSPNVLMSVAPGDVGSEAFGTGTGGSTLYSTKTNLNLRAQYGRSGITGTFDGVSEQATLDAHVQGLLDARAAALWVPGPDVRVTPDSDIGSWDVGDTVSYTLHSTLSTAGAFRLRKRTVTVSRTGQEAVSVGFV